MIVEIQIKLFGLPSWQHFKNLRLEQLHKLNGVLYSPFFIDYNKPITKGFVTNCRKKFKSEPYRTTGKGSNFNFTYLGFETCFMFGKAYYDYGPAMLNCVCNLNYILPQSDYIFRNNATGGFINNSINLIEYKPDYTVNNFPYSSVKADSINPVIIPKDKEEDDSEIISTDDD